MGDNINKLRDSEQRKALNEWVKQGYVGSIIAGTGFGKSRCGVLALGKLIRDHIWKYNEHGDKIVHATVLVLVPTTHLKDQFKGEFIKWGYEDVLDDIEFMCYQSAHKLKNNHYDIILCDEIHLGLSNEYRKFFIKNTYDKLLCMTATLPEEEEYRHLLGMLAPTAYTITLDECVSLGIVAPYTIYCKPVSLTDTEREEYKAINNQFVYYKYQLGDFNAFDEAKRLMASKNANPADKKAAAGFYKAIRERKKIIDFAENKIGEFQELVGHNTRKKILAFSGANDFTDKLAASVYPLAVSYHSKKTKKIKETALEMFRNDEINILCSTKALNQGLDVPNANMGIICGITSKSLSMIQRIGRLIRFQKGKIGEIYILYVENSQEEKWLKTATKSLNNVNWLT